MPSGRKTGLAVATGVTTGSIIWSRVRRFRIGRDHVGQCLGFRRGPLGRCRLSGMACPQIRAIRLVWCRPQNTAGHVAVEDGHYVKGLGLHLSTPKAILFFGALYSVGVPPGTPVLIFSSPPMMRAYTRSKRVFEATFAVFFGAAGLRILTARIG
mmetsp:Transcript_22313/g.35569  ORF Transcript_22313/g.35569 Transcript_22313/m.35569 type:complete len:155 (-) Transcript_22313:4239-4703(-)